MKDRSNERSAACSTCGKTFARSDTLLRHEKSHHATEDRGPVHRVTNGTFRACHACAAARSRCSGGSPCGRCNLRKLDCTYPNKRRKSTFPQDDNKAEDESPKEQMLGRFSELVFTSSNEARFPDNTNMAPSKTIVSENSTNPGKFGDQQAFQTTFPAGNMNLTTDVNMTTGPDMSNQVMAPNQFGNTVYPNQYQPTFNEQSSAYDYGQFDEPLNWIPLSVYPSPYDADLEQDFSFFLPPLIDTPNLRNDFGTIDPVTGNYQTSTAPTHFQEQHPETQGFASSIMPIDESPASSTSDGVHAKGSANGSSTTGEIKRKRRKSSFVPDAFTKPRNQGSSFAFPDLSEHSNVISSAESKYCCGQVMYNSILGAFHQLCTENSLLGSFETGNFPDITSINAFIDLYFDNFHEFFPLIHRPTFGTQTHWMVVIAVAAIGCTFAKIPNVLELREAFQEFLRRVIGQNADGMPDSSLDIPLAQARTLNLVGLTQSDREQLRSLAPRYHADLSRWCLESGVLQLPETGDVLENSPDNQTNGDEWQSWERWIRAETLRRIGYLIWMLDSSLAYIANARPLCNMDDARTPLPSAETTWNASSPDLWSVQISKTARPPSLCVALEDLYSNKSVDSSLSELGHVLLIHALYQRTWEVGTHIKQPLSEWVPTGKSRGFLNTPSKDNFWLPLYPLYANWRNSACDCLDVLNWQASSVVAKAAGVEHNVVLHLHLARIILLTPFQEIQDLLFSLLGKVGNASKASFYVHDGSYQPRNSAKLPQIRKITWRWLREDQHKARLAMIHAGSVFWHVRRYSSNSFYEPVAVYLASIVLWTYGTYKTAALDRDSAANANSKPVGGPSGPDAGEASIQPSRVERKVHSNRRSITTPNNGNPTSPGNHEPSHNTTINSDEGSDSESESSSDQPEFIHLDRPCDDEMVQHFVRKGHNMSGHMSNVGDICQTPAKVLLEGAKLLKTRLACWGVSREYYDILTRLAELRKAS